MASNNTNTKGETMTKQQQISHAILTRVAQGLEIKAAIDEVLGAGTSSAIIDELYERLTTKAVQKSTGRQLHLDYVEPMHTDGHTGILKPSELEVERVDCTGDRDCQCEQCEY